MHIFLKNTVMIMAILLLVAGQVSATSLQPANYGAQAIAYLELLDQSNFQDAWSEMSPLYCAMNVQTQWQQRISAIRQAYGPIKSRELRRTSYRTSFRNAPDGEYIIMQFDSAFEYKFKGIETVVLQCTPSKSCTVIDYVIN